MVSTTVMRRAQTLINPKNTIFIHVCKDCQHQQKQREKQICYETDRKGIFLLMINLCSKCLDGNLSLAESYATLFGKRKCKKFCAPNKSNLEKKLDGTSEGCSYFMGCDLIFCHRHASYASAPL
jgi:hypothetical protein